MLIFRKKSLVIVQPFTLGIALCNQPGLIPLYSPISLEFDLIHPLTAYSFLAKRKISENPSVIVFKTLDFNTHCLTPMLMLNSLVKELGFRISDTDKQNSLWAGDTLSYSREEDKGKGVSEITLGLD
jgi:hypothetical protein